MTTQELSYADHINRRFLMLDPVDLTAEQRMMLTHAKSSAVAAGVRVKPGAIHVSNPFIKIKQMVEKLPNSLLKNTLLDFLDGFVPVYFVVTGFQRCLDELKEKEFDLITHFKSEETAFEYIVAYKQETNELAYTLYLNGYVCLNYETYTGLGKTPEEISLEYIVTRDIDPDDTDFIIKYLHMTDDEIFNELCEEYELDYTSYFDTDNQVHVYEMAGAEKMKFYFGKGENTNLVGIHNLPYGEPKKYCLEDVVVRLKSLKK